MNENEEGVRNYLLFKKRSWGLYQHEQTT